MDCLKAIFRNRKTSSTNFLTQRFKGSRAQRLKTIDGLPFFGPLPLWVEKSRAYESPAVEKRYKEYSRSSIARP
jgi:hypothetical protein